MKRNAVAFRQISSVVGAKEDALVGGNAVKAGLRPGIEESIPFMIFDRRVVCLSVIGLLLERIHNVANLQCRIRW